MYKDRLNIVEYLNQNNDNYLEIANLLRDEGEVDFFIWTFRELFQELDSDYVIAVIDEQLGRDHQLNLDDTYIEDEYGDFSKLTSYYYEFDFLDLEHIIEGADQEVIDFIGEQIIDL